jgi:hypothetical protein
LKWNDIFTPNYRRWALNLIMVLDNGNGGSDVARFFCGKRGKVEEEEEEDFIAGRKSGGFNIGPERKHNEQLK